MLTKPVFLKVNDSVFINMNKVVSLSIDRDMIRKTSEDRSIRGDTVSMYFESKVGLQFTVGEGPGTLTREDFDRIVETINQLAYENDRVGSNTQAS